MVLFNKRLIYLDKIREISATELLSIKMKRKEKELLDLKKEREEDRKYKRAKLEILNKQFVFLQNIEKEKLIIMKEIKELLMSKSII